jgi:hypothetical protein
MKVQRIIALVLLLGIVVGYLVVPGLQGGGDKARLQAFPSEKDWEQCSNFEGVLAGDNSFEVMSLVGSPTILRGIKDPEKTMFIAIGIEKQFTTSDKQIIKEFMKAGGKVIIADDYSFADDLSNEYGVTFYGQTMWDQYYLVNDSFPVVPANLSLDRYLLSLSKPTGLANQSYEDPSKGEFTYTWIANGSEKSYVDRNNNKRIDPADAHDNIPIVLMVQYNMNSKDNSGISPVGRMIFFSDTAPFTNDMFIDASQLRQKIAQDPTFYARGTPPNPFNISQMKGTNREFIKNLVDYLLPAGGKIILDESRHPQTGYTAAVYSTLTTVTIVTSNPLQAGLLSVGLLLALFVMILRARDKESWIHRFDISSIYRRATLPDTRPEQVEHLKKALLAKVRMLQSLSADELRALTPVQIAQLVKDHDMNELLLNENKTYTPEEIRALALKLRAWGRA